MSFEYGMGRHRDPWREEEENELRMQDLAAKKENAANRAQQKKEAQTSVQPKLQNDNQSIVSPDDASEKQADEVSQKVVEGKTVDISGISGNGGNTISPKSAGAETPSLPENFNDGMGKSSGTPLNGSVKTEMESKMNADFGDVKIHTDSTAQGLAESINAKAFTSGQDIYFGKGNSPEDKSLLAHELVHTQQNNFNKNGEIRRADKTKETKKDLKKDISAVADQVHEFLFAAEPVPMMVIAALQSLPPLDDRPSDVGAVYKKKYGTELSDDLKTKLPAEWQPLAIELISGAEENALISTVPADQTQMDAQALKLRAAITSAKASDTIAILLAFDRNPAKVLELKKAYHKLKKKKDASEMDLFPGLSQMERDLSFDPDVESYALFLLNGLEPTEGSEHEIVDKQTIPSNSQKDKTTMLGGNVTYNEDVSYKLGSGSHTPGETRGNSYKLSYQGGLSEETRWLQFVWRELIPVSKGEEQAPLSEDWEEGHTTSVSERENLYVDGFTQFGLPFYEGGEVEMNGKKERQGGVNIRGKNETSIFDAPKSLVHLTNIQLLLQKYDMIKSRVHTISYLVRHFMPVRKYTTTYEWNLNQGMDPGKEPKPMMSQKVESVTGLDGPTYDVMIASAPQLKYIRKNQK